MQAKRQAVAMNPDSLLGSDSMSSGSSPFGQSTSISTPNPFGTAGSIFGGPSTPMTSPGPTFGSSGGLFGQTAATSSSSMQSSFGGLGGTSGGMFGTGATSSSSTSSNVFPFSIGTTQATSATSSPSTPVSGRFSLPLSLSIPSSPSTKPSTSPSTSSQKSSLLTLEPPKPRVEQLGKDQKRAFDAVLARKNVFITGSAGTGKSFLLSVIVDELKKEGLNVAVTASTGIAAEAIGGITLHSFAGTGVPTTWADFRKAYPSK